MPVPWEGHVQKTAQLTVFPGQALRDAPAWGLNLFDRILAEFNGLARQHLLGVSLVAKLDQGPQRNGMGADVSLDASVGPCPFFNAAGRDELEQLPTGPNDIKGRCFRPLSFSGPGARFSFSWKAFIFVPVNPMVGGRTAGPSIRMAVALHELIHACGLNGDDPGHGTEGQPLPPGPLDIFATEGRVFEGTDRIFVGGTTIPDASGRFTITGRTASLIQSIWLLGRF